MQNTKIISDIPKVARKEISFALYNYKNLWIVNSFLDNFYKDTFLYSIGVK